MTFMWDPCADFQRVERELRPSRLSRVERRFTPSVDVFEVDDAFLLTADLPGVKREDLDIQFEDDVLTLSGKRGASAQDDARAKLSERSHGTFVRRFVIPSAIDPDAIEANLSEGVLSIKLPKQAAAKPRRIQVNTAPAETVEAPKSLDA